MGKIRKRDFHRKEDQKPVPEEKERKRERERMREGGERKVKEVRRKADAARNSGDDR